MIARPPKVDICLLLEGSYPYVQGGVSSWVQELILSQPHLTFSVVAIVAREENQQSLYPQPKNLLSVTRCSLSEIPVGNKRLSSKKTKILHSIEQKIISFLTKAGMRDLHDLLPLLKKLDGACGSYLLLDSPAAWELLVNTYTKLMPQSSFIDYFWSFRALLQGFYSILLTDIPPARVYHTCSTGYAGLLGARCHLETGRPLVLTEHGIYTNERRVELLTTDWLDNKRYSRNYTVNRNMLELHDLWIGIFSNYSRICYESCSKIVTLYRGNQIAQMDDGANPEKMTIIPNGVEFERFSSIQRITENRVPTIAFIGRVVPIKDVKTFIRSCAVLKPMLPEFRAYIMGPKEESFGYYEECCEMIEHLGLTQDITFTGNVNIMEYLPRVDVIALTSISEAQPLVILEAGAAGIPTVATRVGACAEIIMGKPDESPQLGAGGEIVPLSNPQATAQALYTLLTNKEYYDKCSAAIRERVNIYYNKKSQQETYRQLYENYLKQP